MGTSNWQNIPFCVEALMKIAPQRVLDVGVGFGRWGMIVREFCDVWFGHVFKQDWTVSITGIEGFAKSITDYHRAFYNRILIGDAQEIIFSLDETFHVIIFGDVLEHFERPVAERLLNWSLEHSDYVLVNIPLGLDWPQQEVYENPYEKHLSAWVEEDFDRFGMVRKSLFIDYAGRPFGSFVLSRLDPKDLRTSLFSSYTHHSMMASSEPGDLSESGRLYRQALQLRNAALQAEMDAIRNSRGYRLLERLKASPLSGVLVRAARLLAPKAAAPSPEQKGVSSPAQAALVEGPAWSLEERAWLEQQAAGPRPLSLNNPEWRGILASTNELFDNVFTIPDTLDEARARHYAELFVEAGVPSVTIQGFPFSYYHLVKALRAANPKLPIYVIWHGNFLHSKEDFAYQSFNMLSSLHAEGDIARVGFVKQGMAEVMAAAGMKTAFIMNMVRRIPEGPSQPLEDGKMHIGIWAEPDWGWKKLPYAMLASLSLLPGAYGHVYNVSPRAQEFGERLRLNASYQIDPIPHSQVMETLPRMHLNLYVSLTECAPMLPLESLSLGAPCLFGPTSHYFLDNPYLHERLVVPAPDNAETIARCAARAAEERAEIIAAYRAYAPEYNRRAQEALAGFLEWPAGGGG